MPDELLSIMADEGPRDDVPAPVEEAVLTDGETLLPTPMEEPMTCDAELGEVDDGALVDVSALEDKCADVDDVGCDVDDVSGGGRVQLAASAKKTHAHRAHDSLFSNVPR